MLTPDTAILIDNPRTIWCVEHLEPYREHWPTGYIPATLCLIHQMLTGDEEFINSTGGTIRGINACIAEYGPLCCRCEGNQPGLLAELEAFVGDDREAWTATLAKYGPPPANHAADV